MNKIKRWLVIQTLVMLTLTPLSSCQPRADPGATNCHMPDMVKTRSLDITKSTEPIYDQLNAKEVVFTLDDGPHIWRTKSVLDVLDQYCVKATFFLQGNKVKKHPKLVARIVDRGHTIGSHSYSHPNLLEMSVDEAIGEIDRGRDALRTALEKHSTAQEVRLFRFPFVATSPALTDAVKAAGYQIIDVQADGADWTRNTPSDSTNMILEKLVAHDERGIILLHDPVRNSDQRVAHLIETLVAQGYRFVTLTETATP